MMKPTIPPKLRPGDRIAVVSPARSLKVIPPLVVTLAIERLKSLGLDVVMAGHCDECDPFNSSSIASRVDDLHWAFANEKISGVFCVVGGFSSNQLLQHLDYDLIKQHPKVLCGYSDITAVNNALFAKTGLVTYCGPFFSSFGQQKYFDYTLEMFKKCLFYSEPFELYASSTWSDDDWWNDQQKRELINGDGWWIFNEGYAQGSLLGGNLCTFNLLHGTEFMPNMQHTVLFLEDDEESFPHHFDRDLQSVIQQSDFTAVKGLVIGRFQKKSGMTKEKLKLVVDSKHELKHIPVIANVDFGHTDPFFTFPVGGKVSITAKGNVAKIEILEH